MRTNGKRYPLWDQFVEKKADFIGAILEDHDMGDLLTTEVTDVELAPNGETSAFFWIRGKDFDCGFDVTHGGVTGGERGWLTFMGYGGHMFRVKTAAPTEEKASE